MGTEEMSKPWKMVLFCSLTIVTTANIVCMNLSRTVQPGTDKSSLYYSSTSVFSAELTKIALSTSLLMFELRSFSRLKDVLRNEILMQWRETIKLSVPAIVYVIQNNLSFFALGNLDPATYQVTYQLKLLTTALVMRVLLGKILSNKQWGALFVLLIGVCLVEVEKIVPVASDVSAHVHATGLKEQRGEDRESSRALESANASFAIISGIMATIGMTFCSAFAGVYFEKMVRSQPNKNRSNGLSELSLLWIKNIQLYIFSCASALGACWLNDGAKIAQNGFFYGYNTLTVVVVLIGSAGGTATALMLKYLDNIYKNFASSMSLVLASICSFLLTGQLYGPKFFLGSFLVCFSLFIYQSASTTAAAKSRTTSDQAQISPKGSTSLPIYTPNNITKA